MDAAGVLAAEQDQVNAALILNLLQNALHFDKCSMDDPEIPSALEGMVHELADIAMKIKVAMVYKDYHTNNECESLRAVELRAASSYLSQGPAEVLIGLGAAEKAEELVIRWPSGRVDRHGPLAADSAWRFEEGGGAERLPR